jgi:hypothetical protein
MSGTQNDHNKNVCHEYHVHSAEEKNLQHELEKQQFQLEMKDKELAMKDRENDNLREIIALLKREPPAPHQPKPI